jgi:siderophore synthetase component
VTAPAGYGDPAAAVAHLAPGAWARANRALVAKAIAEFSHERLLLPDPDPGAGAGWFTVDTDDPAVRYRFQARRYLLDHWVADPDSITPEPDAVRFVLGTWRRLEIPRAMLPAYLEEISSTLSAAAYKLSRPAVGAGELAGAGFQEIEAGMTEGHPCFVANSGRLGFDAAEYRRYAPEVGAPVRLVWVAARRGPAEFSASAGLGYDEFVGSELDGAVRAGFDAVLRRQGLDPAGYLLVPVHPWQWWNRLAVTFAADLGRRDLVCLGEGPDGYQAQQSIRTFFNTSVPHRHYVKTALSVLNMGFLRGLSAAYMRDTPAINDWVAGLVAADPVLRRAGLGILRERAAVGYRSPHYEAATEPGSPYRKMLAALWRESPVPALRPGERLATMASLLHLDGAGRPLVGALVSESGLAPADWLRAYLDAYLVPVLHCFYRYGLVFMPHGENVILALDGGVPRRVFFKDIGEEIAVLDPEVPLPPRVERVRAEVPDELRALSVLTDVFDCFFRFLAPILDRAGLLSEVDFWAAVAGCVRDYQRSAPELADRFRRYDLFTDRFPLSCLNRLQLRDHEQMVDLADPAGSLRLAGTLTNPLAAARIPG